MERDHQEISETKRQQSDVRRSLQVQQRIPFAGAMFDLTWLSIRFFLLFRSRGKIDVRAVDAFEINDPRPGLKTKSLFLSLPPTCASSCFLIQKVEPMYEIRAAFAFYSCKRPCWLRLLGKATASFWCDTLGASGREKTRRPASILVL